MSFNTVSMARYHVLVSLIGSNKLETGGIVLQYPSLIIDHMLSLGVSYQGRLDVQY